MKHVICTSYQKRQIVWWQRNPSHYLVGLSKEVVRYHHSFHIREQAERCYWKVLESRATFKTWACMETRSDNYQVSFLHDTVTETAQCEVGVSKLADVLLGMALFFYEGHFNLYSSLLQISLPLFHQKLFFGISLLRKNCIESTSSNNEINIQSHQLSAMQSWNIWCFHATRHAFLVPQVSVFWYLTVYSGEAKFCTTRQIVSLRFCFQRTIQWPSGGWGSLSYLSTVSSRLRNVRRDALLVLTKVFLTRGWREDVLVHALVHYLHV